VRRLHEVAEAGGGERRDFGERLACDKRRRELACDRHRDFHRFGL
jgi:hypothetical protein